MSRDHASALHPEPQSETVKNKKKKKTGKFNRLRVDTPGSSAKHIQKVSL